MDCRSAYRVVMAREAACGKHPVAALTALPKAERFNLTGTARDDPSLPAYRSGAGAHRSAGYPLVRALLHCGAASGLVVRGPTDPHARPLAKPHVRRPTAGDSR